MMVYLNSELYNEDKMTLTEALNEQMKDESFKKEYEALEPEYEIISSLIDARKSCNVTQKQLSEVELNNRIK